MFAANPVSEGRLMNWTSGQNMRGGAIVIIIAALLAVTIATAQAQTPPQGASPAPPTVTPPADTMAVPGFWDPRRRPDVWM